MKALPLNKVGKVELAPTFLFLCLPIEHGWLEEEMLVVTVGLKLF